MSDNMHGQSWVAEWTAAIPWERDEESVLWLKTRPEFIRVLMLRFPPSCVVRATKALHIPAPGTCGIITSWLENGQVSVRQHPDGDVRAVCDADSLEVVGYWRGLTPAVVASLLSETE